MNVTRRSGASRATDHLEIAIGFLGFWGAVLVGVVIWQQLSGQNAAGWSLLLALIVAVIWLLWRQRCRLQRKLGQHQGNAEGIS